MVNPVSGTFRSLRSFNFRLWTVGGLISNTGTWMQRVAQDWLVLTQLTHRDASALGIVMGLQFAPLLLLLPWTGSAADRLNQRKLLMFTQATMGALALIQGALTIAGVIQLWHVPARLPVRLRRRARCSGQTDLRGGDGRRPGSSQRRSLELNLFQRRADDWPRHRRPGHG